MTGMDLFPYHPSPARGCWLSIFSIYLLQRFTKTFCWSGESRSLGRTLKYIHACG
jgi:hypothetical protein